VSNNGNGNGRRGLFVFVEIGKEVSAELLFELTQFEQSPSNPSQAEIEQFSKQIQQRFNMPVQWRPAPF